MLTTFGTGTKIIAILELELNQKRIIAKFELEVEQQSVLALEPICIMIEQQKNQLNCELVTELEPE